MHILKELITRDEHWGDEHSTIFCFHSDDLKLLRTPELTEPWYYLFHSIPKCEVLDADGRTMQPCKGFLFHRLEQHGWSTTMDGSAACSSGAAVHGADIIYLPSLLYTPKSFPLQCIPRSCSNTITLYFLWSLPTISSSFLSPITQRCPRSHMYNVIHYIHYSAWCLSNTSRLTQQRLFSHGCSGNDCMTCRNRFSAWELQEWTWVSELPALVWAGLCSRPFYLQFFPSWQWRKQSERNTVATGWNLALLMICAGPSWAFW